MPKSGLKYFKILVPSITTPLVSLKFLRAFLRPALRPDGVALNHKTVLAPADFILINVVQEQNIYF